MTTRFLSVLKFYNVAAVTSIKNNSLIHSTYLANTTYIPGTGLDNPDINIDETQFLFSKPQPNEEE